jgi:hypothetical protein
MKKGEIFCYRPNNAFLASSLAFSHCLLKLPPNSFPVTDVDDDVLPERVEAALAAAITRNRLLPFTRSVEDDGGGAGGPAGTVRPTRFKNGEGNSSTGGGQGCFRNACIPA